MQLSGPLSYVSIQLDNRYNYAFTLSFQTLCDNTNCNILSFCNGLYNYYPSQAAQLFNPNIGYIGPIINNSLSNNIWKHFLMMIDYNQNSITTVVEGEYYFTNISYNPLYISNSLLNLVLLFIILKQGCYM